MDIKMRYSANREHLSAPAVSSAIDKIWTDLQRDDSRASRLAKKAGVDLTQVRTRKRSEVISVEDGGSGLDPATIAIIISTGFQAFKFLIEKVIIPMIQEDKGDDAIKPEEPPVDTGTPE